METKDTLNRSLLERLTLFVQKRGDSWGELSQIIGVSSSYFYRTKSVNGAIGSDVLIRILLHYSDLSADWLMTGSGTMLKGTNSSKDIINYEAKLSAYKRIQDIQEVLAEASTNLGKECKILKKIG